MQINLVRRMLHVALAWVLVGPSVGYAADQTLLERAAAAAAAAASAAEAADRAAQTAREAAAVARQAAADAQAAAKAAGLAPPAQTKSASAAPASSSSAAPAPAVTAAPVTTPTNSVAGPSNEPKQATGAVADKTLVVITANAEGGNATIKLERKEKVENDSGTVAIWTLSAPLAAGSKSVDIATLDGLSSSASVGYAWSKYKFVDADERVLSLGLQGRLGYKKFKHFNATTLAEESSEKFSKSLAPYVGYQTWLGEMPVLLQAKFDFQRTYKDADAKVLCPAAATFPVTCVNGAPTPPKLTTKRITSLTMRYKTEPLVGEVTLSYDQASKVKGIDIPFYFIHAKDGADKSVIPFNAGLRLGWRSDTRDTSVGLFVGSPFSFWGP